jgi:hypothetical protein
MPIEASVALISDLNVAYPEDGDLKAVGPQHYRNIKTAVKSLNTPGATTGAAQIGVKRAETGAVSDTVLALLKRLNPRPEQFGCAGDGVTNDTAAFQLALDTAKRVYLTPGATYKIHSRLSVPEDGGIFGDGTATIYMEATGFTNTTVKATGTDAVGIYAAGELVADYTEIDNIHLEGFKLECEVGDSRHLTGICIRNATNVVIKDVEIFGLPIGYCIRLDSVRTAKLHGLYLHDCTTDVNWHATTHIPQITGICIDEGRPNSIFSEDIEIDRLRIKDLSFGQTAIDYHGDESDGVNITNSSKNIRITNFHIEGVGEGIDTFGHRGVIANGTLKNCSKAGLKMIYGTKGNVVTNVAMENVGLCGILLGSDSNGMGDVQDNHFTNITIDEVDYDGIWTGGTWRSIGDPANGVPQSIATNTAAVLVQSNGTPTAVPKNNSITGLKVRQSGATMTRVIDEQCGENNRFEGVELMGTAGTTAFSRDVNATAIIRSTKKTMVRAYLGSNQTVSAGATEVVEFGTENFDATGEYNTGTFTFTANGAKRLRVRAQIRMSGAASAAYLLAIRKNVANTTEVESTESGAFCMSIEDIVDVVSGDEIAIRFNNADAQDRALTGSSVYTYLLIEDVS